MEVIVAYLRGDSKEIINETSDLIYHLLVLLSSSEIKLERIFEELLMRHLKKKRN